MNPATEIHRAVWRGFALTIKWTPHVYGDEEDDEVIDHVEITSDDRAPLPLTETGYSSGYVDASAVAALGGPVPFVLAWLDQEADSPTWRKREIAARQLSLF